MAYKIGIKTTRGLQFIKQTFKSKANARKKAKKLGYVSSEYSIFKKVRK